MVGHAFGTLVVSCFLRRGSAVGPDRVNYYVLDGSRRTAAVFRPCPQCRSDRWGSRRGGRAASGVAG